VFPVGSPGLAVGNLIMVEAAAEAEAARREPTNPRPWPIVSAQIRFRLAKYPQVNAMRCL
jgi:hypothetical protein